MREHALGVGGSGGKVWCVALQLCLPALTRAQGCAYPVPQNAAGAAVLAAGQEKVEQKRKRDEVARESAKRRQGDAQCNACYKARYHAQLPRLGCARHCSYCFPMA